jgi:predicted acylesterase/phospholipase RssA
MRVTLKPPSADKIDIRPTRQATSLPGQVVLVLQGGGALGAYQAGVYQALHEAGIEPDWIIGTSIGAINASLIAGNEAPNRLPCGPLIFSSSIWRCRPRRLSLNLTAV